VSFPIPTDDNPMADEQRADEACEEQDYKYAGEKYAGAGWFDSSWELQTGLQVRESMPGDSLLSQWASSWRATSAPPVQRLSLIPVGAAAAAPTTKRDKEPGPRLVPTTPHGSFGHAEQLADFGLGVAAEVTHLDEFSEFGIDGLELV
jgi:hypothetical protein